MCYNDPVLPILMLYTVMHNTYCQHYTDTRLKDTSGRGYNRVDRCILTKGQRITYQYKGNAVPVYKHFILFQEY